MKIEGVAEVRRRRAAIEAALYLYGLNTSYANMVHICTE
jgi:hypothetical protein